MFLSAGIDSVSIAALAKRQNDHIRTFTVGFAEKSQHDETAEAAVAARLLGTHHTEIVMDAEKITSLWHRWLAAADRPSVDGFNTFVVSHAVRDEGKIVALSGLGGDELFGGYPHFATIPRYLAWLRASGAVPLVVKRFILRMLTRGRRESFRRRAEELLLGSASAERLLLTLRRILTNQQLRSLGITAESVGLADDFLVREAADQYDGQLPKDRWESQSSVFETISRLDSTRYMGNTLLRDTDVVSMARSQEVRVPFLDRRLFDYVAALPVSVKVCRGAPLKSLLRKACRDLIPDAVMNRPKTGFTLPVDRWMHGSLRDSCEACIAVVADSGVLEPVGVKEMWNEFSSSSEHVHWVRPMTLVALGNYLTRVSAIMAPA